MRIEKNALRWFLELLTSDHVYIDDGEIDTNNAGSFSFPRIEQAYHDKCEKELKEIANIQF